MVPVCGAKCARACRFLLWSERAQFLILPKTYGVATSVILRPLGGGNSAQEQVVHSKVRFRTETVAITTYDSDCGH